MKDAILEARLEILDARLRRVETTPTEIIREFAFSTMRSSELEDFLKNKIALQARRSRKRLRDLRNLMNSDDAPSLSEAWTQYVSVNGEIGNIVRECLELLGGLAIRHKNLDDEMCDMADMLLATMSRATIYWKSLSVPSSDEALTKTLAQIIRIRFLEWSAWTLPLVAHEFGHIVIEQNDALQRNCSSATGRHPSYHTRLLADAFATYALGPAYAASAIFLRLEPGQALRETDHTPSDCMRQQVMLAMLERMDSEFGDSPFRAEIKYLNGLWAAMLERASVSHHTHESDRERVDQLVKQSWDLFEGEFFEAGYTSKHEGGWLLARQWAADWGNEIRMQSTLTAPSEIPARANFKDVLNAAVSRNL
jgi:hypothetical protein